MCSLNETVEPSTDVQNSISENLTVVLVEITRNRRPKWEQQLPSKLVIVSAEDGSTSLKLKVELETTDTGEVKSVNSFVGEPLESSSTATMPKATGSTLGSSLNPFWFTILMEL